MRIITGTARGTRLDTLSGENTRPTTEKVKEALFSAIQFDIEGRRVLDLFAGSGQLGIEALSRGAVGCTFIDSNPDAVAVIRANLQRAGLFSAAQVVGADAAAFLTRLREHYDIVFMDPPYASGLLQPMLALAAPHINDGGILVCESDDTVTLPDSVDRFALAKQYRYGRIRLWLYRYAAPTEGEEIG